MKIRKIAAVLLAALMLSAALPLAAAENHPHTWVERSRDEATCTREGIIYYTCFCGETKQEKIPMKEHAWGAWQTNIEATCFREGEAQHTCTVCGKTETRRIKKLEHEFGEWTTTKAPTCTEPGEHECVCKVCGHVRVREMEKLAHKWSAWRVTVPATEFSKGVKARTCTMCGLEETEEFYPHPTYKKNDRGEGVKGLQEKLNAAGYSCGSPSGKYGTSTEKAVKKLEKDHGFTQDGVAWPGVQAWLNGEYGWTPPADLEPEDEFEEPEDEAPEASAPAPDSGDAVAADGAGLTGKYSFSAVAEDTSSWRYGPGEKAEVKITVTNTGTEPVYIFLGHLSISSLIDDDATLISWDIEPLLTDGYVRGLHQPGQTSTLTLLIEVQDEDVEAGATKRKIPFWMRPATGYYPEDWPKLEDTELRAPVTIPLPDPGLKITDAELWKDLYTPGEHATTTVWYENTGCHKLYGVELDLYYWDKAAGDYVFDRTTASLSWPLGVKGITQAYNDSQIGAYDVTERDVTNAKDGVARIAFKARAHTKDGTPVESEFAVVEFNVYRVDLRLEAEDTSAGLTPVGGMVTLKVWLTNDGTETMSVDGKDSFECWNDWVSSAEDHYKYGHGEGLFRFGPGATEEMDLQLMVFEKDVQAGEIRRNLCISMRRLVQEGGKRVLPDTPEGDIAGMSEWFSSNTVEVVIPLPQEPAEAEPAPKAPERCSPRFIAAGEGSAERAVSECPEHAAVAKAAAKLTEGAEGPEAERAAWEAAAKLWEDALKKEYDAAVKAAKSARKKALKSERAAFEKLLAARKAAIAAENPGDPAAAAKALAEVLEHKTCLVCYERHTAPDAERMLRGSADDTLSKAGASGNCSVGTRRAGSTVHETEALCAAHAAIDAKAAEAKDAEAWKQIKGLWIAELNRIADERYLAADKAGRAAIAAERAAYGEWLQAREAMLTVLYPEQDAAVQELLAEAVRARVIGLCGTVPPSGDR